MGIKPKKGVPEPVALHRSYDCYLGEEALADESWVPPVDIYETEEHYVLSAELPGVAREDIHVEVSGSDLTIRGERRPDPACAEESYYRMEGMRGHFCRTFSLPELLGDAPIRTSLKDGVLNLMIPKSSKAKRIPIRSQRSATDHG